MQQEQTWNLLARKLTGDVTSEERKELLELIRSKPEIGLYLQALTNLWHQGSQENRRRIADAFRKITRTDFSATEKTIQHKPDERDASFYLPGKNSIAMNFFTANWKDINGDEFCEDVAVN